MHTVRFQLGIGRASGSISGPQRGPQRRPRWAHSTASECADHAWTALLNAPASRLEEGRAAHQLVDEQARQAKHGSAAVLRMAWVAEQGRSQSREGLASAWLPRTLCPSPGHSQ